jgi:hypothetical protein
MSPENRPRDDSSSARSDRDDTRGQGNGGEEATRVSGVELRRDRTTLKVEAKNCTIITGNVHNVYYEYADGTEVLVDSARRARDRKRANERERMKQNPLSEQELEERRKADEEKHQREVDRRREAKRQRIVEETGEDISRYSLKKGPALSPPPTAQPLESSLQFISVAITTPARR